MITPFWPTYHILSNPSGNIVITKVNILSIYHAEYAFLCIRVSECSYRRNSCVKVSRMLLLGYKNTEARVLVFFSRRKSGNSRTRDGEEQSSSNWSQCRLCSSVTTWSFHDVISASLEEILHSYSFMFCHLNCICLDPMCIEFYLKIVIKTSWPLMFPGSFLSPLYFLP